MELELASPKMSVARDLTHILRAGTHLQTVSSYLLPRVIPGLARFLHDSTDNEPGGKQS